MDVQVDYLYHDLSAQCSSRAYFYTWFSDFRTGVEPLGVEGLANGGGLLSQALGSNHVRISTCWSIKMEVNKRQSHALPVLRCSSDGFHFKAEVCACREVVGSTCLGGHSVSAVGCGHILVSYRWVVNKFMHKALRHSHWNFIQKLPSWCPRWNNRKSSQWVMSPSFRAQLILLLWFASLYSSKSLVYFFIQLMVSS